MSNCKWICMQFHSDIINPRWLKKKKKSCWKTNFSKWERTWNSKRIKQRFYKNDTLTTYSIGFDKNNIWHLIKIPRRTMCDHLSRMGFVVKHLRFVLHWLSAIQKSDRVELSKQLLIVIKQARKEELDVFPHRWRKFFFFIEDFKIQWLHSDGKPSTRSKKIISSPNRMISIFLVTERFSNYWNAPTWFKI